MMSSVALVPFPAADSGGGGFSTKPIENLLLHIKYAMLDWVAMTITMYIRWYLTVIENQSI